MALDPKLLEILACPEDKGPLLYFEDESSLYNPRLQRRYAVRDDIPIMLIDEAEAVDDARARPAARQGGGRRHPADLRRMSAGRFLVSVDSLGVLDCLRACPSCSRPRTTRPRPRSRTRRCRTIDDIDNVVFCGMGGSGIVGDVVTTVGTRRCRSRSSC